MNLFFHVDIDSPKTLSKFWGIENTGVDLDSFYDIAMSRALSLFKECGIPATFFCVGEELRTSEAARTKMKEAFFQGHEIANHTYTHPYGLTQLSEASLSAEIARCSDVIGEITGVHPVGFRAPSYDIDHSVFRVLERQGFLYDSSAAWSSLLPAIKTYHRFFSKKKIQTEFGNGSAGIPEDLYFPSAENWTQKSLEERGILEIPIPRTSFLKLPFYSNFHLMAGSFYRKIAFTGMNRPNIVYLIHLIEFVDLEDGIPKNLGVHTNLKTAAVHKIEFLRQSIRMLSEKYTFVRSDKFAQSFMAEHKGLS